MSTIFGAFDRSGRPADPNIAINMRAAMRYWKPDAEEMLLDGDVLLGQCILHSGSTQTKTAPGPFRMGDCHIVADVRLHDRKSLLELLSKAGEYPSANAGEDELILRLYLSKGWQGFDQLQGDFSFAIFDGRTRELLLTRDAIGVRPMFWMDRIGQLVFATEPRGILSHPAADPEIDQDFVVRLLAGLPPDPLATFHRHIRILPPGHVLRANPFSVTLHRYTSPRIPIRMQKVSAAEAQEGFRERLKEAVNCRIEGAHLIASELSGGLDSSAITCVAANLLSDPQRLHVFSNVLPDGYAREYQDESRYIDEVIRFAGITNMHRISYSGRTDFREALDLDLEVNAGVEYMTSTWLEPVRHQMESLGINIVLSGFMGDHVVSHSGRNHWADLADEGHYFRFMASCLKYGRPDLLLSRAFKRLLPDALSDIMARIRTSSSPSASHLRKDVPRPAFIPNGPAKGRFPYKQHLLWTLARPSAARRIQNEALYGIKHRIKPTYPLADLRLIEWVLSLPVSIIGHKKVGRYLFRQSMEGILPESVRWRTDKDVPAGIYFIEENRRFNDQVRQWVQSLRKLKGHPLLDLVDFDRIMDDLDPHRTANQWQGRFSPSMPFHLQALLRYTEITNRKG